MGGGASTTISVDRARHGSQLRSQLDRVEADLATRRGRTLPVGVEAPRGFYLEFESPPGFNLKFDSLEYASSGIELVAARRVDDKAFATVYVPEGKIGFFLKRIEQYLTETSKKSGRPKNQSLIDSIANIRLAIAESFWTDEVEALPPSNSLAWWEVWLRGDDKATLDRFREQAKAIGVSVGEKHLAFPERTVVLAQGKLTQFASSLDFLDTLAELRRAGDIGSFFTREKPVDQAAWIRDLVNRTKIPSNDAVAVCILDTGVNRGHPLLSSVLTANDMHACKPQWRVSDHNGHGTEMAGIATYGDLRAALVSREPIELRHRLESVKILPPPPDSNRKELYGAITAEGVSYAEITAPIRALIVDSAEWTPRMRQEFDNARGASEIEFLLRYFGYGVPNLERALWSAGNALTLVAQDELQPFTKDKSNEMHLHKLPWPRNALASLGEVKVELRVTLSYFIEPNPARRGWQKRHRYASHGLRFAVQKASESVPAFRKRVNGAAREENEAAVGTGDAAGWTRRTHFEVRWKPR